MKLITNDIKLAIASLELGAKLNFRNKTVIKFTQESVQEILQLQGQAEEIHIIPSSKVRIDYCDLSSGKCTIPRKSLSQKQKELWDKKTKLISTHPNGVVFLIQQRGERDEY
jgi:hypothetical protein